MRFIEKYNQLFFIAALLAIQIAYTTFEVKYIYRETTYWIHNTLVLLSFVFMLVGVYGWISIMNPESKV